MVDAELDGPTLLRGPCAGDFVRASPAFEARTGLATSDLGGSDLADCVHPDDRGALEAALERRADSCCARHRCADGEWLPMAWQIRFEADGPILLGRVLTAGDAAPSRDEPGAEEPSSMAETLEAMVGVIEASHPGLRCSVLILDDEQQTVTVGAGPSLPIDYNSAVEGLAIGPTVGSCGTAAFWNTPVVVHDIGADPLWRNLREHALAAGLRACWSHPIRAHSGESLGALAFYADVARGPCEQEQRGLELAACLVGLAVERARAERELQDSERKLREASKLEALGVMAGGIAHDFNNMLAIVLGNAEMALLSLPASSPANGRLDRIIKASHQASDLCNQMLAYAGRGLPAAEQIDLGSTIRELGTLLGSAFPKKIVLDYDLSTDPLTVEVNPVQLRQVIMNLVTNAADAIADGPGRVRVTAHRAAVAGFESSHPARDLTKGDYARITVEDDGCGMDDATAARIFDPFFSTKRAGRGLGLSAVQGIVRAHRGAIWSESRVGRGTTFTILLPLAVAPAPPRPRAEFPPSVPRGHRILVVDDEDEVRAVTATVLTDAGYEVVEGADGAQAIELFERSAHPFDLVFLDLSMPVLDGFEVLRELRRRCPEIPVVIMSGFTEHELLERAGHEGPTGILHKPTPIGTLLRKVQEILGTPLEASR